MAKKLKGTGYQHNSPDVNNPHNLINSNRITMNGVKKNLLLIPTNADGTQGNPVYAKPGDSDFYFPDYTHVLEIPLPNKQDGGKVFNNKKDFDKALHLYNDSLNKFNTSNALENFITTHGITAGSKKPTAELPTAFTGKDNILPISYAQYNIPQNNMSTVTIPNNIETGFMGAGDNYRFELGKYKKPVSKPIFEHKQEVKPVMNKPVLKGKPSYKDFLKTVNPDYIGNDYALEEAYDNLPQSMIDAWAKDPENNHLPDTYKLPNHSTFSNESKYYKEGMPAGQWINNKYVPINREPAKQNAPYITIDHTGKKTYFSPDRFGKPIVIQPNEYKGDPDNIIKLENKKQGGQTMKKYHPGGTATENAQQDVTPSVKVNPGNSISKSFDTEDMFANNKNNFMNWLKNQSMDALHKDMNQEHKQFMNQFSGAIHNEAINQIQNSIPFAKQGGNVNHWDNEMETYCHECNDSLDEMKKGGAHYLSNYKKKKSFGLSGLRSYCGGKIDHRCITAAINDSDPRIRELASKAQFMRGNNFQVGGQYNPMDPLGFRNSLLTGEQQAQSPEWGTNHLENPLAQSTPLVNSQPSNFVQPLPAVPASNEFSNYKAPLNGPRASENPSEFLGYGVDPKKKPKRTGNIPAAEAALLGINALGSFFGKADERRRQKQLDQMTHADQVFSSTPAGAASRGDYTTNSGYFQPQNTLPVQFPGASGMYSKFGGAHKKGEDLYMDEAEIEKLRSQGYNIQYLD